MDRSSVRVIVTILVLKTQNYLAGCTNKSLLQHSQAMNKIELVALHQTSSLISKPRELEKDAEQKRVNHHDHATEFLALTSFIPIVELNFYLISHCTNHFKKWHIAHWACSCIFIVDFWEGLIPIIPLGRGLKAGWTFNVNDRRINTCLKTIIANSFMFFNPQEKRFVNKLIF